MKPVPTMFYVVSHVMARAIKEGRDCKRGTMYGVFATAASAAAYVTNNKLGLCSTVVEK